MEFLYILLSLTILIFSAVLHEIAHGYVADRLGDPTARIMGRLTLNPIKHLDPFMSLLLPIILLLSSGGTFAYGGAKPVPVDPYNLKDGRKDLALVSLAGPMTNILIGVNAAMLLNLLGGANSVGFIPMVLFMIINLNIWLAIFNLLPIPPLDGSKLFAMLLPEKQAYSYLAVGEYGTFILFFLLFFPIGPFSLQTIMGQIHNTILSFLGL